MGLRLFKGLCLLFLPNVPGAMFIQGGTFIPDSRVECRVEREEGVIPFVSRPQVLEYPDPRSKNLCILALIWNHSKDLKKANSL